MSKLTTFVAGAGVGAAAAYFLDSKSGTRRRKIAADKAGRFTREGAGTVQGAAQAASAQATAVAAKAQHAATGGDSAPGDDNTLKSKVESEIFRDADVPKGQINVNVEDGVVYLRGELEQPDLIEDLGAQARKVQGVRAVENLLHVPGEEAAAKAE